MGLPCSRRAAQTPPVADETDPAKAALAAADIKEVERFTGIAISANDRRAEPFAIRAAIRRRQGNKAGEAVMAKLAARPSGTLGRLPEAARQPSQ